MVWQDDHESQFDIEWLLERNFSAENRKRYLDDHYRSKPQLWSKSQFDLKTFQAHDVFETDEGIVSPPK